MNSLQNQIAICTFLCVCALQITIPVVSPLFKELGFSASQTGFAIGAGGVTAMLSAVFWGKASDRFGRKIIITIGLFGAALTAMLHFWAFFVGTFVLLLLSRALVTSFLPAIQSSSFAYMADITSEAERPAGMAKIGIAMGLGMVLGPAIGGVLASIFGLYSPLFACVVMLFLGGIFALFKMADQRAPKALEQELGVQKVFSLRLFAYLLLALFCISTAIALQIVLAFYLQDIFRQNIEQSAKHSALCFAISGVFLILAQALQSLKLQLSPKPLLLISGCMVSLALLGILLSPSSMLLLPAFAVLGAGSGLGMIGMNAGASLCVGASGQGLVAALVNMNVSLAAIIAPFIGPLIYDYDPKALFIALFCCVFGSTLFFSRLA